MDGESPSSNGMTEELLTSRFGSHESVCKPDQPDLGQVMVGRVGETGKVDQLRRNIYKVGAHHKSDVQHAACFHHFSCENSSNNFGGKQ